MRWLVKILLAGMALVFSGCAVLTESDTTTRELRCEYRVNPLGLDVVKPRLSWILQSNQRGQKRSAYQILVAGDEGNLKSNQGDLWDTGKVNSDQSIQVAYAGNPLKSRMQCYWKVRVWDKDGKVSAWSEPAFWTMGLLEPNQWQAKWIGYDAEPPASYKEKAKPSPLSLEGCKWVWFVPRGAGTPEGDPRKSAPVGMRFFRRKISIAAEIRRARFALVADNEAVLFVNGQEVGKVSSWKTAHTFDITNKLRAGRNSLAIAAKNIGDVPNPAALAGKLLIEFERSDPSGHLD